MNGVPFLNGGPEREDQHGVSPALTGWGRGGEAGRSLASRSSPARGGPACRSGHSMSWRDPSPEGTCGCGHPALPPALAPSAHAARADAPGAPGGRCLELKAAVAVQVPDADPTPGLWARAPP